MKYLYYPGCSLEGSAREYDMATRAVMQGLDVELVDIPDWTCCGATAADAVSRLLALALPTRNLALACDAAEGDDLLVPCSACYLNLKRAAHELQADPRIREAVNAILAEENLAFHGGVRVRHLLDVMASDIGPERIAAGVRHPLSGLIVAPYYGCQCLRPYCEFDDPEAPISMDRLLEALGARPLAWSMGAKCCGASNMSTKPEAGLALSGAILAAARGADAIATVCPMCQMNLEAYQKRLSRRHHEDLAISVIYLPQLVGRAMGLPSQRLGMGLNLAVTEGFKAKLAAMTA